MGLFSRKTIITVSSQHVSLLEEEVNLNKEAVLTAVLSRSPIAQALVQSQMYGMYAMTERYYYYGKTQFTNGLTEGHSDHEMVSDMRLLQVLYKEFPDYKDLRIRESSRDVADPYMFAYNVLRDKYEYDYVTGVAKKGPTGESVLSETTSEDINRIGLIFVNADTLEETKVIETVVGFKPTTSFIHLTYTHRDSSEELVWIYELGSNRYPEIEPSQTVNDESPYYPVVPIRSWNKDMAAKGLEDTELYKTSERMLSKITMDFKDLANSINTNENVKHIDNVFFGVKVDIRDEAPIVSEYLGRYFYSQYKVNNDSKEKHDAWVEGATGRPPPYTTVMFQDGFYKHSISFSHIESSSIIGTIAIPTVTFNIRSRGQVWTRWWRSFEYERSSVTYVYQDGIDVRTITVHGLVAIDYISGKHTVDINLGNSSNSTTQLMIPVHRGIVQEMSLSDRNSLFHSAIYLTINTYDKRKEKWYETSAFKTIVTIVGIVVIYMSWGALAGEVIAGMSALAAAATIIGIMLLIKFKGVIFKFAAKLLVEIVGIEAAAWLLAVLVVIAVIYAPGTAQDVMQFVSTNMIEGMEEVTADVVADIASDIENMAREAEEFQDELDAINKEVLGDRLDIDPAAILAESRRIQPIYLAQESAEGFYARVDGGKHINENILSANSAFHTQKLTPPTLDQVLKQFERKEGT